MPCPNRGSESEFQIRIAPNQRLEPGGRQPSASGHCSGAALSEEIKDNAMKLPASDQVVIEVAKLRDYLLSFAHPVGRFKAAFFAAHGYTADNWRQLEADLKRLVEAQDVNKVQSSRYGQKYEVRGNIKVPNLEVTGAK